MILVQLMCSVELASGQKKDLRNTMAEFVVRIRLFAASKTLVLLAPQSLLRATIAASHW